MSILDLTPGTRFSSEARPSRPRKRARPAGEAGSCGAAPELPRRLVERSAFRHSKYLRESHPLRGTIGRHALRRGPSANHRATSRAFHVPRIPRSARTLARKTRIERRGSNDTVRAWRPDRDGLTQELAHPPGSSGGPLTNSREKTVTGARQGARTGVGTAIDRTLGNHAIIKTRGKRMGWFKVTAHPSGPGGGAGRTSVDLRLPDSIVADLEAFGRYSIRPTETGALVAERGAYLEPDLRPMALLDPALFCRGMRSVAESPGGWVACGATRLLDQAMKLGVAHPLVRSCSSTVHFPIAER